MKSAMMKIAAPIKGGMVMPMVDAVASNAAETWGGKPARFIKGMVKVPVLTTLAEAAPEIMPNRALATIATFAGPPIIHPKNVKGRLINRLRPPDCSNAVPRTTNRKTKLAKTRVMEP